MNDRRERWLWLILVAILIVPQIVHTLQPVYCDEKDIFLNVAHLVMNRTLIPAHTKYPTFFTYVALPVICAQAAALTVTGHIENPAGIVLLAEIEPVTALWAGRMISVAALAACAALVGCLVARRWSSPAGGFAGLLLLVTPSVRAYGAYMLPDIFAMLLVAAALVAALPAADPSATPRERRRRMAVASLFVGLAVSTKYNAGGASVIVAATALCAWADERFALRAAPALLAAPPVLAAVGFLIGSPAWLLAPQTMWSGLSFELEHASAGHLGSHGIPVLGQLELLVRGAPVLTVAAIAGAFVAVRRRDRAGCVCLAMVLGTLGLASTSLKQSVQYLYPMFPAALVLAGLGMHRWLERSPKTARATGVTVLAVLLALSVASAVPRLRPNTSEVARRWIYETIPAGTKIAVDWEYVPKLYSAERIDRIRSGGAARIAPRLMDRLERENTLYDVVDLEATTAWLDSTDAEYVMTGTGCYARFFADEGGDPAEPRSDAGRSRTSCGGLVGRNLFTGLAPDPDSPLAVEFETRRLFYDALLRSGRWAVVFRAANGNGEPVVVLRRISPPAD